MSGKYRTNATTEFNGVVCQLTKDLMPCWSTETTVGLSSLCYCMDSRQLKYGFHRIQKVETLIYSCYSRLSYRSHSRVFENRDALARWTDLPGGRLLYGTIPFRFQTCQLYAINLPRDRGSDGLKWINTVRQSNLILLLDRAWSMLSVAR